MNNARNPAPIHSRLVALLLSVVTLCWLSLLTGCNGGDDATATTTSTTTTDITPSADAPAEQSAITGVAAIGRPLDGYVYIQDAAGIVINVSIAADGSYQTDASGMQPPFIVRAQASDGRVWYSYAPSLVPANVSQLTTLVMFIANGKADLAALYDNWVQRHDSLTASAMLHAQAVVNLNFSDLFEQQGLDHTVYNFFTANFAADGTGFDAVLDAIGPISFGAGIYQFSNPAHQAAFNENIPVTDQGMIDSLGSSVTFTTQQPDLGTGIIIHQDPPVFDDFILIDDDTTMTGEPPSTQLVMICAGSEDTCPEGASCTLVECNPDGSSEPGGGDSEEGYELGGTVESDVTIDGLPPYDPPLTD